MKGFTELGPLHMVSGASGSEVGPSRSSIAYQLLSYEQGLLIFSTVEEVELGLNGAESMVGFQRLSCFGEGWRLGGQEFHIGALCLILSIANHGAIMAGIGHEEAQQLGLLIP
jgi:hypothetical protein